MSVGAIMGEISNDEGVRPRPPAESPTSDSIDGENKALRMAAKQPAAVVSTQLAELVIKERRADDSLRKTGATIQQDVDEVSVDNDGTLTSTRQIIDELKVQFQAQSEVAVLAQANQLPNPALPFSVSSEG